MTTLLSIAVGVLVVAIVALLLVIIFSKKKHHINTGGLQKFEVKESQFFQGLQSIHINQPDVRQVFSAMQKHIVGMDYFLHGLLIALLAGGHVLVEGAPGLAKTKTIRLLASLLDLNTKRIQFTPDMLPADLIGVDMFNQSTRSFETFFGPLFTNILLADEINRATPKVQSALLEAMQEKQVSIGGTSYPLTDPFFVLATQNPIEQDGTYPLPEAQLDRFMMKLSVDYPSVEVEKQILETVTTGEIDSESLLSGNELLRLQKEVQQVGASKQIIDYIATIVTETRELTKDLSYGSSPRGSLALLSLAKSVAFLEGRNNVEKNDVLRVILPALRHRIILSVSAQMDEKKDSEVLYDIVHSTL